MCESDMVTLPRAEAQVQYRNCAESALTIHVYFTHCASARGRALQTNKMRLGILLRRERDCMSSLEIDLIFDDKHVLPHCHISVIHLLLRLRWKRKKHSVGSILANRVKRINPPINLLHCSFFKEQV